MSDSQDRAEALDDDKLGGEYPPDRPLGVDDPTTDDAVTDSVADRERRLVPDGEREEPDDGGNRVSPRDEDAQDPSESPTEVPEAAEEAALEIRDP